VLTEPEVTAEGFGDEENAYDSDEYGAPARNAAMLYSIRRDYPIGVTCPKAVAIIGG
jgi:hypothetical protein